MYHESKYYLEPLVSRTIVVNLGAVVEQLEEEPLNAVKVGWFRRPRLELDLDLGERHRLHLHVGLVVVVVPTIVANVLAVGVIVVWIEGDSPLRIKHSISVGKKMKDSPFHNMY